MSQPGSVTAPARLHLSKRRLLLYRFSRRRSALVGTILIALLVALAAAGPHLVRWDLDEPDFTALSAPPSSEHWLGTDLAGADILALAVHGLGRSLMVGVVASLGAVTIAAFVGTSIAYFGGRIERVATWMLDMLLVVPTFFLFAFMTQGLSGKSGWLMLALSLMAFGWVMGARVIRAMTLSIRESDYVKAARYMGVGHFKIIRRHLIPNLGSILVIQAVLGTVLAVEAETALSFIGFGIAPPDTSLGVMIKAGSLTLQSAPWMFVVPAGLLLTLCVSVILVGDGLRDALDPDSEVDTPR